VIDYRDLASVAQFLSRVVPGYQKRVANLKGPIALDGQIPSRNAMNRFGTVNVNGDTMMRHSAVWACINLRAELLSTFPLDVYRNVLGARVHVTTPEILVNPGGPQWPLVHWLHATQVDLDRFGNTFGIITERTNNNLPAVIELQQAAKTIVRRNGGKLQYKFGNDSTWYGTDQVWHERQYPVAGLDVGMSPVNYAAWTIGEYLSMQDFALEWFGNGGMPKAELKHLSKKLDAKEARIIKDRYVASVNHGDIFVHGIDWEWNGIQAEKMGNEWLDGRRFSLEDVARFFGVPTDLIDATAGVGSNIKYANITQQHLKLLVLKLAPIVIRREMALTQLTAQPRYVKLNTDGILRMDPLQRAQYIGALISARLLTNDEARALDDREPLTPDQIESFVPIYGPPAAPPTIVPVTSSDDTKS
jgi:HK97 family phage portal protein